MIFPLYACRGFKSHAGIRPLLNSDIPRAAASLLGGFIRQHNGHAHDHGHEHGPQSEAAGAVLSTPSFKDAPPKFQSEARKRLQVSSSKHMGGVMAYMGMRLHMANAPMLSLAPNPCPPRLALAGLCQAALGGLHELRRCRQDPRQVPRSARPAAGQRAEPRRAAGARAISSSDNTDRGRSAEQASGLHFYLACMSLSTWLR